MANPKVPTAQDRANLKKFVTKVKADRAYAAEVKKDPVAALRKAGMSDDMIAEVLYEDGYDELPEGSSALEGVSGVKARKPGCTFTCLCSGCCLTPWE
jgi:hypothetical protein